jgi:hypothetical protein
VRQIDNYSVYARQGFDCAANILAVEYLIKVNDPNKYGELIEKLYKLEQDDLEYLQLMLSLNMHINNLGEMITQGDYPYQMKILLEYINKVDTREFKVGDFIYLVRARKQMMKSVIIREVVAYKIIQIVDKFDGYKKYKVYNTKHGPFNEMQIDRCCFYTWKEANYYLHTYMKGDF